VTTLWESEWRIATEFSHVFQFSAFAASVETWKRLLLQPEIRETDEIVEGNGPSDIERRPYDEAKIQKAINFVRVKQPRKLAMIANHIQVGQSTLKSNYMPELRRRGVAKRDGVWTCPSATDQSAT
jgi:hypothetical protein